MLVRLRSPFTLWLPILAVGGVVACQPEVDAPEDAGGAGTGEGGSGGAPSACVPPSGKLADATHGRAIAIDAQRVYWTDAGGGQVLSVSKCGGPTTVLASGQESLEGIAVDDQFVYWANMGGSFGEGRILRVAKDGGSSPIVLADNQLAPTAVVVDGTAVYWSGYGAIHRVALAGGPVVKLASGLAGGFGIAIDDTHVYGSGYNDDPEGSTIGRVPKAGGDVEVLAISPVGDDPDAPAMPWCVAVDADNVYWTHYRGPVRKVAKQGGAPIDIGPAGYQRCLAVDATRVYWPTDGLADLRIRAVGKDGGEVQTVAEVQGGFIAVDETHVFWTTTGGVHAAPKP
jgi:hypothetical protein